MEFRDPVEAALEAVQMRNASDLVADMRSG